MKMKWWEIAALVALLGAIASLSYGELVGFASDTSGWIWLGSSIVTLTALFGAGWPERDDSLAKRRWKAWLWAIMPLTQLVFALRFLLPANRPMNGPYCIQVNQADGWKVVGVVCPPLWLSILLSIVPVIGSALVLMYGFWLRRQNE